MSAETAVIDDPATAAPAEPKLPLFTQPPAPEPKPAVKDEPKVDIVQMTRAEYDLWLADRERQKQELAAKEQARLDAEEKAARNAMEKGHFDKAFEKWEALAKEKEARLAREKEEALASERAKASEQARKLAEEKAAAENALRAKEARAKRYALDGELGRALASQNLVDGAAEDLTSLLRGHFNVEEHGESFAVRSADGRGVNEFVQAYLAARPHYIKAGSNRPGTITGPAISHTIPMEQPPAGPDPSKMNMGQAIVEWGKGIQKAQGDARTNMSLGFMHGAR